MTRIRIATFNLENLDVTTRRPTLDDRVRVLRPQLERMAADVLCLQEVHAQESNGDDTRSLTALETLVAGTRYETYEVRSTATDGGDGPLYDERNLVVLSRFPVLATEQVKQDLEPGAPNPRYGKVTADPPEEVKEVRWERPILHVTLDIGHGRTLHVVNLHLKSKIPTNVRGRTRGGRRKTWLSAAAWAEGYFVSSMKRVGQALETRQLVDRLFDEAAAAGRDPYIAVVGDFNADFEDVPVMAIRGPVAETNNPDLGSRVLVPCELSVPESARYSLLHRGREEMIDHVLVSRPLLAHYRGTEIHNEVLPDESSYFGDSRIDRLFPESDHAPVIADFELS
jgi:predicted extracellular nuclease